MSVHSSELCQSYFANPPKVLYYIDMVMSQSEFILRMFYSIMSIIAVIDKPIVTLKSVGLDNCISVGSSFNYR